MRRSLPVPCHGGVRSVTQVGGSATPTPAVMRAVLAATGLFNAPLFVVLALVAAPPHAAAPNPPLFVVLALVAEPQHLLPPLFVLARARARAKAPRRRRTAHSSGRHRCLKPAMAATAVNALLRFATAYVGDTVAPVVAWSSALYVVLVVSMSLYGAACGLREWARWLRVRKHPPLSVDAEWVAPVVGVLVDVARLATCVMSSAFGSLALAATAPVSVPLLLCLYRKKTPASAGAARRAAAAPAGDAEGRGSRSGSGSGSGSDSDGGDAVPQRPATRRRAVA
jgi:hypothetical protein